MTVVLDLWVLHASTVLVFACSLLGYNADVVHYLQRAAFM
jgi:hypothetical protein